MFTNIQKGNVLILIVIAIAMIAVTIIVTTFGKTNNSISQVDQPSPKATLLSKQLNTFHSNLLKFDIEIPLGLEVEEKTSFVDLKRDKSKINISKAGTNIGSISDYVSYFDSKRVGMSVTDQKRLTINGNESIDRIENFSAGSIVQQKIYYIYVSNIVYTIATSSPSLYSDLDQIAQSFRYTPN